MEQKTFNLLVAAGTFIIGALYIIADDASITANVIGASGGSESIASILGLFLIIASGAFFALLISHQEHNPDVELERMVRYNDSHPELKREIHRHKAKDMAEDAYQEK